MTDWSRLETSVGAHRHSAEDWMQHIWANASPVLRRALPLVWRRVFGLSTVAAGTPNSVMGWRIESQTSEAVTVAAASPLFEMRNTVIVRDDTVTWRTAVVPGNRAGRAVWGAVRPLHAHSLAAALQRAIATPPPLSR